MSGMAGRVFVGVRVRRPQTAPPAGPGSAWEASAAPLLGEAWPTPRTSRGTHHALSAAMRDPSSAARVARLGTVQRRARRSIGNSEATRRPARRSGRSERRRSGARRRRARRRRSRNGPSSTVPRSGPTRTRSARGSRRTSRRRARGARRTRSQCPPRLGTGTGAGSAATYGMSITRSCGVCNLVVAS